MKIYSAHGINEFIICCGYKGYVIKEYFANYFLRMSDVTFDLRSNQMDVHNGNAEPWRVTLVDTGESTMTGGRLRRVREHIGNDTFCFTYGDGVSDVNITDVIRFHKEQGTLATLTAVQPPGRFGAIALGQGQTKIQSFHEKPEGDGAWVNGGYFVLEPEVIDYIDADSTTWEREPLQKLAQSNQLSAYRHAGFWQPMDTLRDKHYLEDLWKNGKAPWKIW
jgi:glucose-1-phosphate cytidylyltransferase